MGSTHEHVAPFTWEPSPCEGCRFAARCGAVGLACSQFSGYVAGEPERKWRKAPRVPSDAIYRMLFEGGPAVGGGRPRGTAKPARIPNGGYRPGPERWFLGRIGQAVRG